MPNDLRRVRNATGEPTAMAAPLDVGDPLARSAGHRVPRTRSGAAWVGICIAALRAAILIMVIGVARITRLRRLSRKPAPLTRAAGHP